VQELIAQGALTSEQARTHPHRNVVTQALGVKAFHIGPQIAPGVPWVRAIDAPLSLALKSGNFGSDDFFDKAQEYFHD
jgi:uncharacterized protein YgbK (DUF1537 family)